MAAPAVAQVSRTFVQEIAKRGDEIPDKFIVKNGFPEAIDAPELWKDTLLIDFSLLSSSSPAAKAELAKLRSALSDWGCFQVINHGMESSFLEGILEATEQFFALSLEEKVMCSSAQSQFQGYGNESALETHNACWHDRIFISLYPEESRNFQLWPQKPENFRELVDDYSKRLLAMSEVIYKAMARSLNLEEDCFLNHMGKPAHISGRFSVYPRVLTPERVLGVKPHTDGATMAVLLPEKDVEGLQIQKDDQWYKVPTIPGALFFNLGELAEVMTNGIFKSTMHRVVANSVKDRISVIAFFTPEESCEIEPVCGLISNDRPQVYKKFKMYDYRRAAFENHVAGRKAIDALKT